VAPRKQVLSSTSPVLVWNSLLSFWLDGFLSAKGVWLSWLGFWLVVVGGEELGEGV